MKKLAIALLLILCLACVFTACTVTPVTYTITSEKSSYNVQVGQQLDYKSYFTITSSEGENIPVLDEMIDTTTADVTKEGAFIVTCSYEGASKSIIFVVQESGNNQGHTHSFGDATCTQPATCSCGETQGQALGHTTTNGTCARCGATIGGGNDTQTVDLSEIFANYTNYESWNFSLKFRVDANKSAVADDYAYTLIYHYDGNNFYYTDEQQSFVDYVVYTTDDILYYFDNQDGTHAKLSYNDNYEQFAEYYYYTDWVDLASLGDHNWVKNGDHYQATSPSEAGNALIGEFTGCTYTTVELYISNGKVAKIVATQQDDDLDAVFTYTVELSNYGSVTVDVSNLVVEGGSSTPDQGGDDNTGGDNTGDNNGGNNGDDNTGGDNTQPTQTTTTFSNCTGSTTLSGNGEVNFVANRAVDGWEDDRGVQFQKQLGSVTLTSTTTVNSVSSITIDISANKTTDITVTVKVGSTVFTCNGQNQVVFQNIKHNILTFTSTTAVSGTVTIQVVPSKTNASELGSIYFKSITLSATGVGSGGSTPSKDMMPEQSFNSGNHVDYDDILYDAMTDYDNKENCSPSTGLPSQGAYNVLVIPVEFSNDKFTNKELADLSDVFNNKASTGWESVSSYYQASSYNKLNLTFDIVGKVALSNTYNSFDGGNDYGEDILKLALDQLDARGFDFSKYDVDSNGVIDGVYIIYSAPIGDDYYWAYVNWAQSELEYDNLGVYTYLFASVDFMYEDIATSGSDYAIAGLKLNASTYIHETGHMLGLDDYYDYNPNQGSDMGLGCADMMDYTVGDHNAYSKLLLGWVKPTVVVTSTQTITISSFESSGQFIMILLDYDGTYFSEYLIIDLYSATGLNELHANVDGSYLYDGASFGARIYHVDSSIKNPFHENEYGSFTDNNNSVTTDPLLKLVEADGDKNFESDREYYEGQYYTYAAADDLWQTGDEFSKVQTNYTRNDGKLVNFDISFDSVTANSLTVTITFTEAE